MPLSVAVLCHLPHCHGSEESAAIVVEPVRWQRGDMSSPCQPLQRLVFSQSGNTPSAEDALGNKCLWGLWGEHGAGGGGGKTHFVPQAHVQRCQLFTLTAPGPSVALLLDWGLLLQRWRCAPRLQGGVIGGVGLGCHFGSTDEDEGTSGALVRLLLMTGS